MLIIFFYHFHLNNENKLFLCDNFSFSLQKLQTDFNVVIYFPVGVAVVETGKRGGRVGAAVTGAGVTGAVVAVTGATVGAVTGATVGAVTGATGGGAWEAKAAKICWMRL